MGILSRIKNRLSIIAGDPPRSSAPPPMAPPPRPPVSAAPRPAPPPQPSPEEQRAAIERDVRGHAVVIYMKGSRTAPQCGFSAAAVDVFEQLGVPFETRNVLSEGNLRQAIKDYTDWPTIPQVFVGGEFIGGADILRELHEKGELKTMVEKALADASPA
jgi:monothiol glutaredoxin